MSEFSARSASHSRASAEPVVCAKCRTPNPHRHNKCSRCGAHLYVSCHHCGHSNERAEGHCAHCGSRLHRSVWRRWRKRLFPEKARVKPLHLILLVVLVAIAYKVIVKLAEFRIEPVN